jgi:tRNA-specific 2-thiouridylase
MERIAVGLSGGVDSSVAAALLLERGYEVHGVSLKLWKIPNEQLKTEEITAQTVAEVLGIPLIELDLSERFYREIVESFADSYIAGFTPNPCVICNPTLKFQALLEAASNIEANWVATGHYARVKHKNDNSHLHRGCARNKDQSYALYRLEQQHLRHLQLPLGLIENKSQVREIARKYHLPSAEKTDSQDLCFMGGGDYRQLLQNIKPTSHQPGPVLDEAGHVLGTHRGLAFYTIGQRSGLGIASSRRLYVTKLDAHQNTVILGPRESLNRYECLLESVTFTTGRAPASQFTVMGCIRYRAPEVPIEVTLTADAKAKVRFINPQQLVAPGQSLVFYRDTEVLGGGIISDTK